MQIAAGIVKDGPFWLIYFNFNFYLFSYNSIKFCFFHTTLKTFQIYNFQIFKLQKLKNFKY